MTQALPIPSPGPSLFMTPTEVRAAYPGARVPASGRRIARRPTPQQGIALEILGHAIEYLADTNFYHQRSDVPAVKEALVILKQSDREVFAEAPEVVAASVRAVRWLRSHAPARNAASGTTPVAAPGPFLIKR